jgi:hypothetical protein
VPVKYIVSSSVAVLMLSAASAHAADGCPPGSVSVTPSGGGAFSALFGAFFEGAGESSKCRLSIPTGDTGSGRFIRVYSADYRGAITLADGESASLTTEQASAFDETRFGGPYDGDLYARTYVGTDADGNITSVIGLDLTNAADGFSFGALDSADYALVATADRRDLERSVKALANERLVSAVGIQSLAETLQSSPTLRMDSSTYAGLVGGVGSPFIGAQAQAGLNDNLTANGGVAYFEQDVRGTNLNGLLASGSIRYMPISSSRMKPFVEAAMRFAYLDLDQTRSYSDGNSTVNATSNSDGWQAGASIKAGVVSDVDKATQLVGSVAYSSDWTRFGSATENFGPENFFAAAIGESRNRTDTIKAEATWTTQLTDQVDIGLNGGVGVTFGGNEVAARVAFAGNVTQGTDTLYFATYGARVGFKPSDNLSANLYVEGISTSRGTISPRVGGALTLGF